MVDFNNLKNYQMPETPELTNYLSQLSAGQRASDMSSGMIGEANYLRKIKEEQEGFANKLKAEELRTQLEDMTSYKRVPKEDGGYDFFAPGGEKITAYQYAREKGTSLEDALQGSTNVNDYEALYEFEGAKDLASLLLTPADKRKDDEKQAIEEYLTDAPEYRNKTAQEVVNMLRDKYPWTF